jgi:hypothetical protein
LIFLETGWAWYPLKHQVLIHHDQETHQEAHQNNRQCICQVPLRRFHFASATVSEHLSNVGKYQFLHPGSTESAAHKSAAFRDSNGDRPIVDARQCGVDTSPSLNRRILGCGLVNYEFAI